MPDYVYALHDFLPEHEDEVTFLAGERIEVVEKDDQYGDGWWQGRNLAGRVGLFPVSYTAPAPPATESIPAIPPVTEETTGASKSIVQPLHEEFVPDGPTIMSPVPKAPQATFLNGDGGYESADDVSLQIGSVPDGEVMKATMTDVQKALEQLGRGGAGDGDGASFSFASTRDGGDTETDTDFDMSDVEGPLDVNGEDWHKNARRKLADNARMEDKARMAVESAQKLEDLMAEKNSRRPPIEVELSDESDAEDDADFTRASKFQRSHPYILEEDENEEAESHTRGASATETQASSTLENHVFLPAKDENEVSTATATRQSFPIFSSPPPMTEVESSHPISLAPSLAAVILPISAPESKRNSAPPRERPTSNGMPSPTTSPPPFNITKHSKHNSTVSSASAPGLTIPTPQATQTPPQPPAIATSPSQLKKTHPVEWSLDEVVDWLKTKGFDQDVCDKFTEQEITGDVLLELDVNLLKSEIGIKAFGKRMRIANAIADLRRPPSVEYSDRPVSSSEQPSPMQFPYSNSHSRSQSVSQSHHSFPGTPAATQGHAYSQSVQSSLGSPIGGFNGNGAFMFGHPFGTVREDAVPPPAGPATPQNIVDASRGVNGAPVGVASAAAAGAIGVGLGIALSSGSSGPNANPRTDVTPRSAQLIQSPSDGALRETLARRSLSIPNHLEEEDRGHMSDGGLAPTSNSMRRRLFGRSQDSSVTHSNSSHHHSPLPSPTVHDILEKDLKEKEKDGSIKEKDGGKDSVSVGSRRARPKKSTDGKYAENRVSIFGGTFGGTLGKSKSRKPPPSTNDDQSAEKSSRFSLLVGPGMRKSSSQSNRPSTPTGSPKDFVAVGTKASPIKDRQPDPRRESTTLRKRTVSAPQSSPAVPTAPASAAVNTALGPFKQGQSILEQIGEPDHTGWMKKKGDRYNTWKLRYFVLKGPHLYILRSNTKAETKIKGYIHIVGYKVTVDENIDPGRYGFRIDHDHDKAHFFSSEEKSVIRDWMKAIMKATIGRDYTRAVVSSCNIPTIPLVVAQAMNPAPRPPSPSARDATQKALRRENPHQLSSRDARVLMGLSGNESKEERNGLGLESFFSNEAMAAKEATPQTPRGASAPPRPSREVRRSSSVRTTTANVADDALIDWANSHLPEELQITNPNGPLCGGLGLLRLAESILGRPSSPPVLDSAFPLDPNDDKIDGLFRLFDFLLDNDVRMGSVSINDVRQGKRDKILQLLRALKAWEDKRKILMASLTTGGPIYGGFVHGSYITSAT